MWNKQVHIALKLIIVQQRGLLKHEKINVQDTIMVVILYLSVQGVTQDYIITKPLCTHAHTCATGRHLPVTYEVYVAHERSTKLYRYINVYHTVGRQR